MNDFTKISQWISEIEQSLTERTVRIAQAQARVAKKLTRMTLDVTAQEEFTVTQEKMGLLKRLNHYARMIESADTGEDALALIEEDVDSLYGNQSQNGTYYFGRRGASVLEEMEALTTFQPPVYDWNTSIDQDDSVRSTVAFEDDGNWIDQDDMLDIDRDGPYQSFGPKKPLNDRTPDDF